MGAYSSFSESPASSLPASGITVLFPRLRDIADAFGSTLRLTVEPGADGAQIVIERRDDSAMPRITLNVYSVDLLQAFILAARLTADSLPDEVVGHPAPLNLRLVQIPVPTILLVGESATALAIPAPFWDRLYAELGLALAHARELDRQHARLS